MLKDERGYVIKSLVLLEGFMVLALQILVSVIVTPYWGNSFIFWSASLFYTMLALAIGYFFAPILNAKLKQKDSGLLTKLLWFIFLYMVVILGNSESMMMYFISSFTSVTSGIFATLFIYIFIPVICLGMIPILSINIIGGKNAKNEGKMSGIVFSNSSLSGSIAVALLTFITLPYLGVSLTKIVLIVLFSIPFGAFLLLESKKYQTVIMILIIVFSLSHILTKKELGYSLNYITTVEKQEGVLGQIKVIDNAGIQTRFLYVNNAPQSKTHFSGRSLYPYLHSIAIYCSYKEVGGDVLLAGVGGGSLAYELSNLGYNVQAVDIDGRLEGVIDRNFLKPEKKVEFIESDVRRFVNTSAKKYDIIILDLSKGESVPTNVYTLEGFNRCKELLNDDGILIIHFLSSLNENGKLALASVGKTLNEAGLEYKIMNRFNQKSIIDGVTDVNTSNGYIFFASSKINLDSAQFRIDPSIIEEMRPKKANLFLEFDDTKGVVLTDDKPYLDVLQQENAINMRKENIKTILAITKNE